MPVDDVRILPRAASSATLTVASVAAGAAVVALGGVVGATVGFGASVGAGAVVGVLPGSRLATACWKAAIVAASTTPVGSTPSAVWKSFKACVSSSVQMPSTGLSQKPTSARIV